MKIISLLDELGWTQYRLAVESHVSPSTIRRLVQEGIVSRQSAEKICIALSRALERKITIRDIDEIEMARAERPERRKSAREEGEEEEPGEEGI